VDYWLCAWNYIIIGNIVIGERQMARLDIFIQEIENRKVQEIRLLESTLAEKKAEIEHSKEITLKGLQDQYLADSKTKSQKEFARIVEAAKLNAKKILFEAINANMDSTFGVIKQEMENYVQNPEYKNLLKKMINYAKNTLGPDIIIHCRGKDNSIVQELNIPIGGSSINTVGGILAENKEGTRELDLTFEELLRSREDDVKGFLVERMTK
jgi:V/A-type H+/Na+-transporting ATPase subunit E